MRKLLAVYKEERSSGNDDPLLLRKLRLEFFPDLPLRDQALGTDGEAGARRQLAALSGVPADEPAAVEAGATPWDGTITDEE